MIHSSQMVNRGPHLHLSFQVSCIHTQIKLKTFLFKIIYIHASLLATSQNLIEIRLGFPGLHANEDQLYSSPEGGNASEAALLLKKYKSLWRFSNFVTTT